MIQPYPQQVVARLMIGRVDHGMLLQRSYILHLPEQW